MKEKKNQFIKSHENVIKKIEVSKKNKIVQIVI